MSTPPETVAYSRKAYMLYHILDTETASLQGGVCEIAWIVVNDNLDILQTFVTLVNPEREIDPRAAEVHGITQERVATAPTLRDVARSLLSDPIVLIGHNCAFDQRMIKDHIKVTESLCTLKLARTHLKTVSNHKLETLQKELNLPEQKSHSALGDVYTCRDLLRYLREHHGVHIKEALAREAVPKLLHTMPFGKHKGRPIANIAEDYRNWLLGQEIDKDLRYTLETLKGV